MKIKIELGKNEVEELKDAVREFDVDDEEIEVVDQVLYYDNGPLHFEGANNSYELQIKTELVVFMIHKFKKVIKIFKSAFNIIREMVDGVEEFFNGAEEVSTINGKNADEYWEEIHSKKSDSETE